MNKIKKFFKSHTQVIIWTVCYVVMVWAILRFLFNFDVFAWRSWLRLTRMELHGFGGLVFGMFILAAIPLYFATTVVIARTHATPFKIPLPRWLQPEPAVVKQTEDTKQITEREEIVLPNGAPSEMREAFIRARRNAGARHQYSVFNKPKADQDVADANQQAINATSVVTPEPIPETKQINAQKQAVIAATPKNNLRHNTEPKTQDIPNGLPLPDSFDVNPEQPGDFSTPVFSDINFDDDDSDAPATDTAPEKSDSKDFIKYLGKMGINARNQNGLFISDKFAIAVHDDDDLWIADDIDWFAAGKQKPSPIVALKNAQTQYDVKPVLFLDNANIMDDDKLIDVWRADGILVAQSTDELTSILTEQ